jgi:hypothetical protein
MYGFCACLKQTCAEFRAHTNPWGVFLFLATNKLHLARVCCIKSLKLHQAGGRSFHRKNFFLKIKPFNSGLGALVWAVILAILFLGSG